MRLCHGRFRRLAGLMLRCDPHGRPDVQNRTNRLSACHQYAV